MTHGPIEYDVLTLCLRLCLEPIDSHSPDTLAVLDHYRLAWEAAAGGMPYDQALALIALPEAADRSDGHSDDKLFRGLLDLVLAVGQHQDAMFEGHPLNAAFIKASDVLRENEASALSDINDTDWKAKYEAEEKDHRHTVDTYRGYIEPRYRRCNAALEKLLSYNMDIKDGRINYRPEDHIQVIEGALYPAPETPPASSISPPCVALSPELDAALNGLDDFLNNPPQYEDQLRVRDYRAEAYPLFAKVVKAIRAQVPAGGVVGAPERWEHIKRWVKENPHDAGVSRVQIYAGDWAKVVAVLDALANEPAEKTP